MRASSITSRTIAAWPLRSGSAVPTTTLIALRRTSSPGASSGPTAGMTATRILRPFATTSACFPDHCTNVANVCGGADASASLTRISPSESRAVSNRRVRSALRFSSAAMVSSGSTTLTPLLPLLLLAVPAVTSLLTRRTFLSDTVRSPRSSGVQSSSAGYEPFAGRRCLMGASTPGAIRRDVNRNPVCPIIRWSGRTASPSRCHVLIRFSQACGSVKSPVSFSSSARRDSWVAVAT